MSVNCKTSEDLAKAIKNQEEYIEIEGSLKDKTVRIKAVGKVAWGVCAAALGAAILCYIATPGAAVATTPAGGAAALVSGVAATTVAAGTLGSATVTAVAIGVAAGGIGVLNALRDKYEIVEKDEKHIILKRK